MKTLFSIIATSAILLLASCSKEKSIDSTDPEGGSSGGGTRGSGQLVKTVIQLGQSDSTVSNFAYDGQGRFTRQWLGGTQNIMSDNGETRVVRNGQGNIQYIIIKDQVGASDSLLYTVNFNSGTGRYTYKTLTEQVSGTVYRDSIVYSYNSSGQITEELYYTKVNNQPYEQWSKVLYTYTNGNLTEYRGFYMDDITRAFVQESRIVITYDNKQSPLVLGAEGIVMDQITYVSPNNVTSAVVSDLQDPSNDETVTYTYVYNDKNKPATATILFSSLGLPIPVTYYYN